MGMLFRNESDIAMGPFFPAEERLGFANPTTVFFHEDLRILAGRTRAQDSNVFGYILAFDWMVWMFLTVALLIISLVTAAVALFYDANRKTWSRFLGMLGDAIWQYVENLFMEASADPPRRSVLRLLSSVWWLATIVLMNAFCGHMRACLMIKSEVERIDSVRQLVAKPQALPFMWKGTSYVGMVANSTNEDLRTIGRTVEKRDTAVPITALYGEALLKRVVLGRAVVISDGSSLVFRVSKVCGAFRNSEFYLGQEGLVSHPMTSFTRKDMDPKLRDDVNHVIRRLVEAGLVNHWWTTATGDMSRCGGAAGQDSASTLAFADLLGIFVLWLVSLGVATAAFCFELAAARLATRGRVRRRRRVCS
ncbi:unnamed protein product [Ixodes hexagonus]